MQVPALPYRTKLSQVAISSSASEYRWMRSTLIGTNGRHTAFVVEHGRIWPAASVEVAPSRKTRTERVARFVEAFSLVTIASAN